jgi:hypothetical protein
MMVQLVLRVLKGFRVMMVLREFQVLRVLKGFRVMMVLREFQVHRVLKVHFQLEHNPVR